MVNVCMGVKDRLELTKQAIWSLFETMPPRSFTLTIVDDGSEPKTANYLQALKNSNPCPIRLVRNETPLGVGGARNQAADESEREFGRHDYLYFSDNDVVFHPICLEILQWAMAESQWENWGFKVIGGYAHPYNQTIQVFETHISQSRNLHEKHAVDGLSWLLTWDTWDRFGKFCDNVTDRRSSEDHEYAQRIRKAGYRVGVVDPPVIINCGRTDSWGNLIPGHDVAIKAVEGLVIQ